MNLLNYLHEINPYDNFTLKLKFNLNFNFGFPQKTLETGLKTGPNKIIEIGSWKGRSAIFMADYLKNNKIMPEIICIDTWLGAQEMWKQPDRNGERYQGLNLKNGYPNLYYQFLTNIIISKHQDCIVPFPNTSNIAFRLLKSLNYQADMIYVDGSHDYEDVLCDLKNYWQLLKINGLILGDDFGWAGVAQAVNEFVTKNKLKLDLYSDGGWIISKNKNSKKLKIM